MNGIAKITIGGREVSLKFGLPAIRRILEKKEQYGIPDADLYNDLGMAHILYAGYLNSCIMKDVAPEISFEIFYNHVESLTDDQLAVVEVKGAVKEFEESRYVKPAIEKAKDTEEKKSQLIGTELNPSSTEISDSSQQTIIE